MMTSFLMSHVYLERSLVNRSGMYLSKRISNLEGLDHQHQHDILNLTHKGPKYRVHAFQDSTVNPLLRSFHALQRFSHEVNRGIGNPLCVVASFWTVFFLIMVPCLSRVLGDGRMEIHEGLDLYTSSRYEVRI